MTIVAMELVKILLLSNVLEQALTHQISQLNIQDPVDIFGQIFEKYLGIYMPTNIAI